MRSLLTEDQLQWYEELRSYHLWRRQYYLDNRYRIADYEKKLKRGDATWNRYVMTRDSNKKAATEYQSEHYYERAIERLTELLDVDPTIMELFDRSFDLAKFENIGPDVIQMPLFILSQSHYCLNKDRKLFPTIKDLKIQAIESAIKYLYVDDQPVDEESVLAAIERGKRLRRLLNRP